MKISSKLLLVLVGAASVAGAAPAQQPRIDIQSVSADVAVLTSRVTVLLETVRANNDNTAAMQRLVETLLDQVQRLPGIVQTGQTNNQANIQNMNLALESFKVNNEKTAAELRKEMAANAKSLAESIEKLGQKLTEIDGRLERILKEVKDSRISTAPLVTEKPDAVIQAAFTEGNMGQYDLAIAGYRDFLAKFPAHSRAAEAQLAIGENLFRMGKFEQSIIEFDLVLQKYSEPDKSSTALYKRALAQVALKDKTGAIEVLNKLKRDYPKSIEAPLADQTLKELQPAPPPRGRGGTGG